MPPCSTASCTTISRLVFFTESTINADVKRRDAARIDYFGGNSFIRQLFGRSERQCNHARQSDYRHVIALPQNLGFTNRHDVIAIGNLPFRPIEPAMLDEDHWVVVANSCLEQAFGVGGIGRHDDL